MQVGSIATPLLISFTCDLSFSMTWHRFQDPSLAPRSLKSPSMRGIFLGPFSKEPQVLASIPDYDLTQPRPAYRSLQTAGLSCSVRLANENARLLWQILRDAPRLDMKARGSARRAGGGQSRHRVTPLRPTSQESSFGLGMLSWIKLTRYLPSLRIGPATLARCAVGHDDHYLPTPEPLLYAKIMQRF